MFNEFNWKGKAETKQSALIKQYCEGGLQMVNLDGLMNGLKTTLNRPELK